MRKKYFQIGETFRKDRIFVFWGECGRSFFPSCLSLPDGYWASSVWHPSEMNATSIQGQRISREEARKLMGRGEFDSLPKDFPETFDGQLKKG